MRNEKTGQENYNIKQDRQHNLTKHKTQDDNLRKDNRKDNH